VRCHRRGGVWGVEEGRGGGAPLPTTNARQPPPLAPPPAAAPGAERGARPAQARCSRRARC
jgi:hypothetical protein